MQPILGSLPRPANDKIIISLLLIWLFVGRLVVQPSFFKPLHQYLPLCSPKLAYRRCRARQLSLVGQLPQGGGGWHLGHFAIDVQLSIPVHQSRAAVQAQRAFSGYGGAQVWQFFRGVEVGITGWFGKPLA